LRGGVIFPNRTGKEHEIQQSYRYHSPPGNPVYTR
jgi:hypothetical protein